MFPTRILLKYSLVVFLLGIFTVSDQVNAQVRFIPNLGQWTHSRYESEIPGGRLFVLNNSVVYNFMSSKDIEKWHQNPMLEENTVHFHSIFISWVGAGKNPAITASGQTADYYNYFLGNDRERWISGVYGYHHLGMKSLYRGIDLDIEAKPDAVKYTYRLAPGINPSAIRFQILGAADLQLRDGELVIKTSLGSAVEEEPTAWQIISGKRKVIPCRYKLIGNEVLFEFPRGYNKTYPLVIDPVVVFATYSGSTADNFGFTGTYDTLGYGYSGGTVYGVGYPVDTGAFQVKYKGGIYVNGTIGDIPRDAGIIKYSPDGKNRIFASYLGGSGNEQPHSMVVDHDNNLIVFGTTNSHDFPVYNGYDTTYNGNGDIYLAKISSDGRKILNSTYIGGKNFDGLNGYIKKGSTINQSVLGYNYGDLYRGDVEVDDSNNVYVATCTQSDSFPVTSNAPQKKLGSTGGQDGCAFKLNPSLNKLLWSTFIGGPNDDAAYSLAVAGDHSVFVTGGSSSNFFFNDLSTYDNNLGGSAGTDVDAFVCHISPSGSTFSDATYLGTSEYDQAYFVQLDYSENVYLYGQTSGTANFPLKNCKYIDSLSGQFITKFNRSLDILIWSTEFGGTRDEPDISPTAFLVDRCGKIYISGWGGEVNRYPLGHGGLCAGFRVTSDAFKSKTMDSSDFYVAVFSRDMDTILYGSYFGGKFSGDHVDGGTSRFDKRGIIYQSVCGGCGGFSDFPTTPGAWSSTNNSNNCNNLLFKVNLSTADLRASFTAPPLACKATSVSFQNNSTKGVFFDWDFGDSTTSKAYNPTHVYSKPGIYRVRLVASSPITCNPTDTFYRQVLIYDSTTAAFTVFHNPCSSIAGFRFTGSGTKFKWIFSDGSVDTVNLNPVHNFITPGVYKITLITEPATVCQDVHSEIITIYKPKAEFTYSFDTCNTLKIAFSSKSVDGQFFYWSFGDGDTSTLENPVHQYLKPDSFKVTLKIIDSVGCIDSISKYLTVVKKPKPDFYLFSDTCTNLVSLKNTSLSAKSYLWNFGDGGSDTARNPKPHYYSADGSYKVTLIVNPSLACPDSFTRTVIIYPRPTLSFEYQSDTCTSEARFVSTVTRAKTYYWDFGDSTNLHSYQPDPVHIFPHRGTFTVTLIINKGTLCEQSFQKQVTLIQDDIPRFEVPNVFSPDGDGKNDYFEVQNLSSCHFYELEVYNRWGELMYFAGGPVLRWDGNFKGKPAPAGVYYYVFRFKERNMERHGSVTLIR